MNTWSLKVFVTDWLNTTNGAADKSFFVGQYKLPQINLFAYLKGIPGKRKIIAAIAKAWVQASGEKDECLAKDLIKSQYSICTGYDTCEPISFSTDPARLNADTDFESIAEKLAEEIKGIAELAGAKVNLKIFPKTHHSWTSKTNLWDSWNEEGNEEDKWIWEIEIQK